MTTPEEDLVAEAEHRFYNDVEFHARVMRASDAAEAGGYRLQPMVARASLTVVRDALRMGAATALLLAERDAVVAP